MKFKGKAHGRDLHISCVGIKIGLFLTWIITPVFINILVKHSLYSKHNQSVSSQRSTCAGSNSFVPNVHDRFGHHNKAAGHKPSSTSLFFPPTRDTFLLLLLPWVEPSPSAEPQGPLGSRSPPRERDEWNEKERELTKAKQRDGERSRTCGWTDGRCRSETGRGGEDLSVWKRRQDF